MGADAHEVKGLRVWSLNGDTIAMAIQSLHVWRYNRFQRQPALILPRHSRPVISRQRSTRELKLLLAREWESAEDGVAEHPMFGLARLAEHAIHP